MSRRLAKENAPTGNADRALWGGFALSTFARISGSEQDLHTEPETVLTDLLADLMHWCDNGGILGSKIGSIDFDSALGQARIHHCQEIQKDNVKKARKS